MTQARAADNLCQRILTDTDALPVGVDILKFVPSRLRNLDRSACPHGDQQEALERRPGLFIIGRGVFGSKPLMGIGNQRPDEDPFGMQVPQEVQLELLERRVQIRGQDFVDLTYRLGLLVRQGFVTNRPRREFFGFTYRISGSSVIVLPHENSTSVAVTSLLNAVGAYRLALRVSDFASCSHPHFFGRTYGPSVPRRRRGTDLTGTDLEHDEMVRAADGRAVSCNVGATYVQTLRSHQNPSLSNANSLPTFSQRPSRRLSRKCTLQAK